MEDASLLKAGSFLHGDLPMSRKAHIGISIDDGDGLVWSRVGRQQRPKAPGWSIIH